VQDYLLILASVALIQSKYDLSKYAPDIILLKVLMWLLWSVSNLSTRCLIILLALLWVFVGVSESLDELRQVAP
jgi:hypothetical protein